MAQYNLFICAIVGLFIIDYSKKKQGFSIFGLFAIIVTISFVVLRDYVGYDYANYVDIFHHSYERLIARNFEWGFIIVTIITQSFTEEYFWLFFIFGLSTILFICKGILLYTTNFRIAFLIYLLTPGLFINSFSIIRQGIAVALLLNAFFYYYNKNYTPAVLYTTFAALFHYSVLIALPFCLFAPKLSKYAKSLVIFGILISLILSRIKLVPTIIMLFLGDTKFIAYANYIDQGTSLIKIITLNTVAILYLFFYKNLDNLNRTLLVLVAIGLMLTNICSDVAAITRIGYYFKIFDCVLIANIIATIRKPHLRLVIIIIVTLYYYALFFNALNVDLNITDYPKLTPYRTIFDY